MLLFKLLSRNVISEINGCVSTGKEANVYHATTPEGAHTIPMSLIEQVLTGLLRFTRLQFLSSR
jgi:serine/threonine-protein kinase RIO1